MTSTTKDSSIFLFGSKSKHVQTLERGNSHGSVLIHNAEEIPCALRNPRAAALAGGESQQAEGRVAQRGHHLRSRLGSDTAAVFAEGFFAHVEDINFNRPVVAVEVQQPRGVGLVA